MGHIKNISISNFKSIHDVRLDDCKRVNVFIGYPNVGKSNILEAISLLTYISNSHGRMSYKDICRFRELIDIFCDGDRNKNAEVNADGFLCKLKYNDKNAVQFSIYDSKILERTIKVNDPYAAAGIRHPLDYHFFMSKGGQLSEQSLSKGSFIDWPNVRVYHFSDRIKQNLNSSPNYLLPPFGENLAEVLRHNSDLRKEVGGLFSDYNLKIVFDEHENIIIQKQLDEFSAFQFSFSQVAETLQRLVFHKAAMLTNQNSILLFEEPEAHMFPPYVSKFTSDIIYDKNINQYFITTHSPYVINDFLENLKHDELSIFVVGYNRTYGETLVRKLSDNELQEVYQFGIDIYMNLENYLPHEQ